MKVHIFPFKEQHTRILATHLKNDWIGYYGSSEDYKITTKSDVSLFWSDFDF